MRFPVELTERKQWITWFLGYDGSKIPNGKSNDPDTWRSFEEIKDEPKLAYVFSAEDPFVGIDLDNCIDDNGELNDVARHCMELFDGIAYCETSQSGKGLHFIVQGKKPDWSVCKRGGVECYDHARFWIMTGKVIPGYETPKQCQEKLDEFLGKYLGQERKQIDRPIALVKTSRLIAYADSCDAPSEGGRNNAGFSVAGHLWAMVDELGSRPSRADVMEAMQRWNARCKPPMDQAELDRIVGNGKDKGTPRDPKESTYTNEDALIGGIIADRLWPTKRSQDASEDDDSDDNFCLAMLPESGLLRMVYDWYIDSAQRPSPVMGLAVAISAMETVLGRKVASHTNLRTNDYNLIVAQTASGKEACKQAITKLFDAAGGSSMLMASDVQSGNGLITALKNQPCSIWIGDEFGKVLQAILDKKGSQHLKNIGKHLLSLYGESAGKFLGAAHAAGCKNEIRNPHLVVLGLSTGSTIFDGISSEHVSDGLLNRICFWPVQERPKRKKNYRATEISENLVEAFGKWVEFKSSQVHGSNGLTGADTSDIDPIAIRLEITEDALERFDSHWAAIDAKMETEGSQRAAMWGRTAARSLLLAVVHRCSRMQSPIEVGSAFVEIQDVNWGIKLSNWLSRIACQFVEQNMVDKSLVLAKRVLETLETDGKVYARDALRSCRSLTSGDLDAAAVRLGFEIGSEGTGARPKKVYRRVKNA
jgi:hypothetical protein